MSLAYARNGLLGVLTPQANTTVEPEFSVLLPPATAMLTARLVSARPSLNDRLRDYVAGLDATCAQFANAPLGAFAFACTGSSYLVGPEVEDAAVAQLSTRVPFITAGRAVCEAFAALGAKRIGLVSPYPPDLTEASAAYWTARGFEVARIFFHGNARRSFPPDLRPGRGRCQRRPYRHDGRGGGGDYSAGYRHAIAWRDPRDTCGGRRASDFLQSGADLARHCGLAG
jgi:maleate isomerase